MSADRESKIFTPPQNTALKNKFLYISKPWNQFWYVYLHLFYSNMKFQTKLFNQTAIRTVFVAVAQKLGNPTSCPGAHFRHQNRNCRNQTFLFPSVGTRFFYFPLLQSDFPISHLCSQTSSFHLVQSYFRISLWCNQIFLSDLTCAIWFSYFPLVQSDFPISLFCNLIFLFPSSAVRFYFPFVESDFPISLWCSLQIFLFPLCSQIFKL
jgi:hypothetical protein